MKDRPLIIDCLKDEKSFYLISHMLPDGDSVGSLLAMGKGLRKLGRKVRLFTPGHIPRMYGFLSGSGEVSHEPALDDPSLTAVVLDSSDPERLGVFRDAVMKCAKVINIDHHVTNQRFGTLNLVDPSASATGEIVYHLMRDLDIVLDRDMAEALYVAISTDTGSFKYENTTPGTHRVAALLLELGVSPGDISQRIFDERPLTHYAMLREAISGLELYAGRKIAVMTLSRDIRARNGATTDDLDGIVNHTRNIEGTELGILFYVDRDEEVKVGFRSRRLDVSALAGRLNGGGHVRAAGCRLKGDFETIKKRVMAEALAMLDELPA